jgi:hypothetical protein
MDCGVLPADEGKALRPQGFSFSDPPEDESVSLAPNVAEV